MTVTMPNKPTLKDVAKLANVSEMTASRVLRGVGDVSDKTKAKVKEATSHLGYVPNRIAGGLASRSVNLVGVVIPSIRSLVFSDVLSGISSILRDSDLQPVFGVTDYDLDLEQQVVADMLSWQPQGIILAGLEHHDATRTMLKNAGIPVVEIMDVDGDPIDMAIGISHLAAGRAMAEVILTQGYRKIGFLGTQLEQDFRAQKRLKGFKDRLAEADLSLADEAYYSQGSSIAKGREMTEQILTRSPNLDCLFYSTDILAAGGLMHCLAHGLHVPDDIALLGFNGLDLIEGLPLELATCQSPRFEIGEQAACAILSRIGQPHAKGMDEVLSITELPIALRSGQSL